MTRTLPRRIGGALLATTAAWPVWADVDGGCTDELILGRDAGSGPRWFVHGDADAGFPILESGGDGWGVARRVTAAAAGDFDGDGLHEIVLGRDGAAAQSVRWLIYDDANAGFAVLNDGGNGWGAARRTTALGAGDVDGDGRDEIAIGRTGPSGPRYFVLDDAEAGFAQLHAGGDWGSDRDVTAMAFGDVDGDGRDELAIGRTGGAVQRTRWFVLDDADAGFAEMVSGGGSWGAGRDVTAMATGDVDADGSAEILMGRSDGGGMRWQLLGDAGAGFAQLLSGGSGWGVTRSAPALGMGDVDADGRDELVVGRDAGGGPRVFVFDDAGGDFEELRRFGVIWGATRGVRAIALGDVDGNRADEIAIGRNGGANERWFVQADAFGNFATVNGGGDGWGEGRAVSAMAFRPRRPGGTDRDGDALLDAWETVGIDADCDGTIDFTPPGADPDRHNVYVEMDWMTSHLPDPDAVDDVIQAFADAPVPNLDGTTGIDVRIDVDEEIPETLDIATWDEFDPIRDARFGTPAERAAGEAAGPSTAEVRFEDLPAVSVDVPALAAGGEVVRSATIPDGCYGPGFSGVCGFEVALDVDEAVEETEEGNNTASDRCIAPAG